MLILEGRTCITTKTLCMDKAYRVSIRTNVLKHPIGGGFNVSQRFEVPVRDVQKKNSYNIKL